MLFRLFCIVLGSIILVSCSSGVSSDHRPFTVGTTSGHLTPVLPEKIPVKIKSATTHKTGDTVIKIENTNSINEFNDLKFEIDLDPIFKDGNKNEKARVNVKLAGSMLIYKKKENSDLVLEKIVAINLSKSYSRYNLQTGADILEDRKFWAFRLIDNKSGVAADILCLTKWSCKTVVVNLYWYETKDLFKKQFHLVNTDQPTRVEPPKDEVIISVSEESKPSEDFKPAKEAEITIAETEQESEGETTEYLHIPTDSEYYVEDQEVVDFNDGDKDFIKDIESQSNLNLVDSSKVTPLNNIVTGNLDVTTFTFDFLSDTVESMFGGNLKHQAKNCQTLKAGKCPDGGYLTGASRLQEAYFNNEDSVEVPYVVNRGTIEKSHGTKVTVNLVKAVSESVYEKFGRKACLGNISKKKGGRVAKKSSSHQNGLDIDYYFYTADDLSSENCVFNAVETPEKFDLERNHYFLTELYKKAQAVDQQGNKYSYLFNIYLDRQIKKRLCSYVKDKEGVAGLNEGSDSYEVLRRISHEGGHENHYHIRLNCHSLGCRDHGNSIKNTSGCESL